MSVYESISRASLKSREGSLTTTSILGKKMKAIRFHREDMFQDR